MADVIEQVVGDKLEEQGRDDRVLSMDEAVAYLGNLPIETLRNLVKKKRIGHVKLGRTTAFNREQLDEYIDAHTVQTVDLPWGLTEQSLRTIREGRSPRARKVP